MFFLAVTAAAAQTLNGVVDIHAHCDPDSTARSIDGLSLVKLAKEKGFRGLVLKNHYEPTEAWAFFARRQTPGIEVFGGIALNLTVGGVNPAAVERMTRVKGGLGRVVWMPTFDSENQVRTLKENRRFAPVSGGGKLLPEVREVLDLIAKHNLVLATGHSTPSEVLMLVREARARGVKQIVVTHGMLAPVSMTAAQMREAGAAGAFVEFVSNAVVGNSKSFSFKQYAEAMRQVGWQSVILSSDFGQAGNPLHPDGLEQVFRGLRAEGVTVEQINRIVKENPARLLGLQ